MKATHSESGSRRLIAIGAMGAMAGIALSAAGTPAGPPLTVASLLLLIVALHRFGRTGADGAPAIGPRRKRR